MIGDWFNERFYNFLKLHNLLLTLKVKTISATLARCFIESEWAERMRQELKPYESSKQSSKEHDAAKGQLTNLTYHTSPLVQFAVVCGRTFKNLIRNPRNSFLQVNVYLIICYLTTFYNFVFFYLKCTKACQFFNWFNFLVFYCRLSQCVYLLLLLVLYIFKHQKTVHQVYKTGKW